MPITAEEILCHEHYLTGDRIMTMRCRYPKFVHAEYLRHRSFSFSVSSGRAIPVSKNLEEVRSDELRAAPVWWGREQKGMQSGKELFNKFDCLNGWWNGYRHLDGATIQQVWKEAACMAADVAEAMSIAGAHKSIVNRILEPFLHVNVLVTGTTAGWMNFFGLRLDKAAQPEIKALAEAQWRVWNESRPQKLQPDQWHLPFVVQDDQDNFDAEICLGEYSEALLGLIKISVARCARLSYESFDTGRRSTIEEDLRLYDRLVGSSPIHASPAEHQATPDEAITGETRSRLLREANLNGLNILLWQRPEQAGNLGPGWRQFRKMLPGEAVAPLPEEYR